MPGMDGVELAREAKRLRPHLRVVLVTGHDSAMDHLIAAGNIALLKPYSAQALARVLEEELPRSGHLTTAPPRLDPCGSSAQAAGGRIERGRQVRTAVQGPHLPAQTRHMPRNVEAI